ncbi:hypothetical protein [Nesterenkonia pannonica]|uniref:hypothetical protein n=1 Tax=Nesterenkonia pannonica TaxID=1548602 RepID=UPI002164DFB1|nr:hypothetical protein [Nesterenkonia pannonica]
MRVFVYNHLPGSAETLDELVESPEALVDDVGRTLAAVHCLTEAVVDHAELPRYSSEQLRQRRLNELDNAAATGECKPSCCAGGSTPWRTRSSGTSRPPSSTAICTRTTSSSRANAWSR